MDTNIHNLNSFSSEFVASSSQRKSLLGKKLSTIAAKQEEMDIKLHTVVARQDEMDYDLKTILELLRKKP